MKTTKASKINLNGWTIERRKQQSQAIHRWKPWQQSTGAKTLDGKAIVSRNAFKGGVRIRLRELSKNTYEILREHKEMLEKIK